MHSHTKRFLTPYQHRHRFWEAIWNSHYKVFPLWPGGNHEIPELHRGIFDQSVDDESILYLDESDADVAFPIGAINQTTVVEVSSALGQDLIDEFDLELGARIWTPTARYYLFNYIEPSALGSAKHAVAGLRIVNDGEWIPYPGNIMDGHLVHWEHDPWAVGTHPMPEDLLEFCV